MLYERWQEVAGECAQQTALHDLAASRRWTFRELARQVESTPRPTDRSRPCFPTGNGPEFIFSVLNAWRSGQVFCPIEAGQTPPAIRSPLPAGICMLKTTSGTTNGPRQVAFTESQVFVDPLNIVTSMGLVRDSPNLGAISLSHSYGFSNLVLPLLLHGIPLTLVPNQLPETIKQAASAGRNWTLPAVPALWHVWNETSSIPRNIRLAISAGSPLPLPLEQAVFVRHGLKIHNFLGSSECGGIAYDASNTPRTDASCVGSALHGVGLHLGDNGCLVVSGTQVGQTYWPEPSDTLGGGSSTQAI